ncbi:ribonuclease H-like domain-containing protein [Coprinopsis sp. MPI-PUGE-AT-0042]|nr:ribonuclease H-like domain-containing protein [Coprinopsis sp. MPI-PUGE-AT-0042]
MASLEEWRNRGNRVADLPSSAESLLRAFLSIPESHQFLLPDPTSSVLDFAGITLAEFDDAKYSSSPPDFNYFSSEKPTASNAATLLAIPAPSKKDPHARVPLWMVKFWTTIVLELAPVQKKWASGITWLQQADLLPFQDIVHTVFRSLASLPWAGDISWEGGFDLIRHSKNSLPTYLSNDWLNDDHIDQLISSLSCRISSTIDTPPTLLLDTVASRIILLAYKERQLDSALHRHTATVARYRAKLAPNGILAGIFHVHGNHWIALAVVLRTRTILYGDSAGGSPDGDLIDALWWFCSGSTESLVPGPLAYSLGTLPCPKQNLSTDSWNCRIFSYNALAHYFFPTAIPLLKHTETSGFGNAARLECLSNIVAQYHDQGGNKAADVSRRDLDAYLTPATSSQPKLPPPKAHPATNPSLAAFFGHYTGAAEAKYAAKKSQKPKKAKAQPKSSSPSVIAPIFKIPAVPEVPDNSDLKRKYCVDSSSESESESTQPLSSFEPSNPPDAIDPSDTDDEDIHRPSKKGRPSLDFLDQLTNEITPSKRPREYQCAGAGCKQRWQPRSRSRVLSHARRCLFLTTKQRQIAAKHSAAAAPGSLVAETAPLQPSTSTSSISSTPSSSSAADSATAESPRQTSDTFFGAGGRKRIHSQLDLAVVRLFCASRLPPNLAGTQEWKNLLKITCPSYTPASRTKLNDVHIQSEAARIQELQYKMLKKECYISISFDGGSIRSGESVYTVHATTQDGRVMLLEGQECTRVSHTGEWIADVVLRVVYRIGPERVICFSADNTGNTRVSRTILHDRLPHTLNLPDPDHHLNNTWKEIASLPFFEPIIGIIRATITFFKQSNFAKGELRALRNEHKLGAGLESIGKTRFGSLVWTALSIQRSLMGIRQLCTSGTITLDAETSQHYMLGTPTTLHFEIGLTQLISVGEPFGRAILCLESTAANPGDVFFYWIALVSRVRDALESSHLPDHVNQAIRVIINRRWREFFTDGPSNAHLAAFFLNPDYARSPIFRNPNALSFNIRLPPPKPTLSVATSTSTSPKVPPGIRCPKTFIEVGKYLHHLLVIAVTHDVDPYLRQWKGRSAALVKGFQEQFTAFAQGMFPFAITLGPGQTVRQYWQAHKATEHGGILAAVVLPLVSAVPHSMAEERTMSVFTMMNTAQRNRQSINTVVAMAQVNGFYRAEEPSKRRIRKRSARALRYFDTKRLRRGLDDDERDSDSDYDESEDEDLVSQPPVDSSNLTSDIPTDATTLPGDDDNSEIDLGCVEVRELLAEAPLPRESKAKSSAPAHIPAKDGPEAGGTLELGDWV